MIGSSINLATAIGMTEQNAQKCGPGELAPASRRFPRLGAELRCDGGSGDAASMRVSADHASQTRMNPGGRHRPKTHDEQENKRR